MKNLTKLENTIMLVIWQIGKGFANEIMAAIPEPKPAYNTTLTVIHAVHLENKKSCSSSIKNLYLLDNQHGNT